MKFNGKNTGAHRIAWTLTNGKIEKGKLVCHTCDNPPCCNPAHMFLGLPKDNAMDKARKGRSFRLKGVNQSQAKLTDDDVRSIRALYIPRVYGIPTLSKRFGVAQSMIWRILHNRNWSHV